MGPVVPELFVTLLFVAAHLPAVLQLYLSITNVEVPLLKLPNAAALVVFVFPAYDEGLVGTVPFTLTNGKLV